MQLKLVDGEIVGILTATEKKKLIAAAELCKTISKVDAYAADLPARLQELATAEIIDRGPEDD
jgi:hypothetical protein